MAYNTDTNLHAEWREQAACRDVSEEHPEVAGAWINELHVKRSSVEHICRTACPVRMDCLVDAINDQDSEGLRGGYWFSVGALLSKDKIRMEREFPWTKNSARMRHQKITNAGMAS